MTNSWTDKAQTSKWNVTSHFRRFEKLALLLCWVPFLPPGSPPPPDKKSKSLCHSCVPRLNSNSFEMNRDLVVKNHWPTKTLRCKRELDHLLFMNMQNVET